MLTLFALPVMLAAQAGPGKVVNRTSNLKTAHYTITITTHCYEGDVGCDHVTYKSLSSTGKSITLQGKEELRMCAGDPKTPCGSLGYYFRNGDVTYHVPQDMIDDDLVVRQNGKEILREAGHWTDPQ